MTLKNFVINLLMAKAEALKAQGDNTAFPLLAEVIKEVNAIGCRNCLWYRDNTCTLHFPGEERHPYYFCKDWEEKDD